MKKMGIDQARERLARAEAAAARLDEDIPVDAKREAWSDFLAQANTLVLKLEVGALGHGKSEAWLSRLLRQRRLDPLLSYVQQARHADEHTLCEGPAGLGRVNAVVLPGGAFFGTEMADGEEPAGYQSIKLFDLASGREIPNAGGARAELMTASLWLKPVTVRGREYPVPYKHLGIDIPGTPKAIAHHAIEFYRGAIVEAEKLDPHT